MAIHIVLLKFHILIKQTFSPQYNYIQISRTLVFDNKFKLVDRKIWIRSHFLSVICAIFKIIKNMLVCSMQGNSSDRAPV